MSIKAGIVHYAVTITLVLAAAVFAHFNAVRVADRAVEQYRQDEMTYWKGKLLPLYKDMGVKYAEDPKNRDELLAPIFQTLTPVQKQGLPKETP